MSRAARLTVKPDFYREPRMGRAEPRAGGEVNDTMPSAYPGHELSDLRDIRHEPVHEAVLYYIRLSQIASYPRHPHAASDAAREPPTVDALPERNVRCKPIGKKRTTVVCISSFLFHIVLFAVLTTASVTLPDDPVEEAGDTVSVVMLGDSDADQLAAGEKQENPEPAPQQVTSEAVQPDVVQPTDAAEATPEPPPTAVQPAAPTTSEVQADPVQPMQQVQEVSPETIASSEPEVMTSQVPAAPTVVQPEATQAQPEEVKPAEAQITPIQPSEVQPAAVQPTEPAVAVAPAEIVTPTERPLPPKPVVQKPREVVKKLPPKRINPKAGSEGENQRDSRRGAAEGTETAQSDRNSLSAGSRQGAGSAEVANYPGKVQSRIRRSVRVPTGFKRMTDVTTVRVRLTIGSGGDLTSLSLSRSSGVSELDNAVLEGVRRAVPFPPLPPEWGKPSWSFTQEVQVTGE